MMLSSTMKKSSGLLPRIEGGKTKEGQDKDAGPDDDRELDQADHHIRDNFAGNDGEIADGQDLQPQECSGFPFLDQRTGQRHDNKKNAEDRPGRDILLDRGRLVDETHRRAEMFPRPG